MSQALTIPSERAQTILRWVVCFAVVLMAHVVAVAKLLEHSDFADAPPGSEVVKLDLALGDPQERIDPFQYTPPKPVEQEVTPKQEPEQKEAEVALPKEVQPETPTPVEATPPQEEQEAKARAKASPDVLRSWQMKVNERLHRFKEYPLQARKRGQQGVGTVVFELDVDGRVVNSKLLKSSGSAILDREILELVSRAQPFPVPPSGIGPRDLSVTVPIGFELR